MTVSQYDHVVPYTDLGGRGYFGVNAALVPIAALSWLVVLWLSIYSSRQRLQWR